MKFCKYLALASLLPPMMASAQEMPKEIEAVRNYLLNTDYPEVFGNEHYRITIKNILLADLDGDGVPEVVAHMKPHYRQSPTIVIFKVDKDLKVQRVMEALAPGPVQAISGKYLDSHTAGNGVDFQATLMPGFSQDNSLVQGIVKAQKGALVLYKQFAHVDSRVGPPSYIDMREAKLPAEASTCKDFEFADIDSVDVTNRFSKDGRMLIAARVGQQVYAIRTERFLPDGRLEKSVSVHAM